MKNDKLFIITRSDLPPGARAAQSVHAALAFAHQHPDIERSWFEGSNNIVLLEAPSEQWLVDLALSAMASGIPYAMFKEPDFGDAVTAVALAAAGSRLVSTLPLTLRPSKEERAAEQQALSG